MVASKNLPARLVRLLVVLALTQVCSANLFLARERITRFLNSPQEEEKSSGKFLVQGWRWHTMALIHEADRLHKLAKKSPQDLPSLAKAVDYVVDFNMKGLHMIESDLFFPWARKKVKGSTVAQAFNTLMDRLESERRTIQQLGASMNKEVQRASQSDAPQVAKSVARGSAKIAEHARSMLVLEETLLVPTIARLVPESEQKAFNNRVLRKLGVFNSRVHLVAMHEAVWALKDKSERKIFDEAIPSIPRRLIPRWKRLLYQPKAGVLDS